MNLLLFVLLGFMLTSLFAVMARDLLHSVIGLALSSVMLTILLFMFNAPFAAVFELSVCAGFITVIFISTISLTRPLDDKELRDATRTRWRRYWPVPFVMAGTYFFANSFASYLVPKPTESFIVKDVKKVMWELRSTDMLAQLFIILVGVIAVIVLFKEIKNRRGQNG